MYPPVRQLTTTRARPFSHVSRREREADAEALERVAAPDADLPKDQPCP